MKVEIGISGAIIMSAANGWKPFVGSVGICQGRITMICEGTIPKTDCDVRIDGSGKILMPGLFNLHCHGDMTMARGFGDDLTLQEQNQQFEDTNWFYSITDEGDRFASRQLTYAEALLSGTTFIMENMYWTLGSRSAPAMKEIGIKGALAEDIRRDFRKADDFWPDEVLAKWVDRRKKAGLIPYIGSISEEDFEPERLQRIREIHRKHGVRQTFHLAETDWRVQRIRENFGMTPIEFLASQNVLDAETLGSHVVHCSDKEAGILAETGTCVVNTPTCEMKIADGAAPIAQMVKAGVTVCLGTDGAMWNNTNDIFGEMRSMSCLQTLRGGIRSLRKQDILDMATINGARAVGLEKETGSIEEGKMADLILLDASGSECCPLILGLCENISSHLIYNLSGKDVREVWVNGEHRVSQGRLLSHTMKELKTPVQKAGEKIAAYYAEKVEKCGE